ncbi:MAG TPA: hypothetical protein DCR92_00700 [Faecalibacterium sp.]|nr:hypothetical protein [Faecalibacterium sp.]
MRHRRCAGSFLLRHDSGHSIARPIAYGNRVPPQRTVFGETSGPPLEPVYSLSIRILPHFDPGYNPAERFCCAGGTFALY